MRELNVGTKKYTKVVAVDEPGIGGANHFYHILAVDRTAILGKIEFQNGPIKEAGVNGIHNEDLLAIVLDRLGGFQSGDYACKENERAWAAIRMGLDFLKERTEGREKRGVEGTNTI